jgi:hypothetical protein
MTSTPSLRVVLLSCLLVVLCASGAAAAAAGPSSAAPTGADNPVVIAFTQAFAGDDSTAKRESMRAVAGLPKELDDIVLKLLVQAVGDRQTHDEAVMALRSRTGLAPNAFNKGNGYPGYPSTDDPADWNIWLSARTKDKSQAKQLADQAKELKELKAKEEKDAKGDKGAVASSKTPAGGDAAATTETKHNEAPEQAPSDLGKPSRIIFKNGGSLVCYVIFKRTDSDGVLQSVRIVHLDGGGEETLAADLIARIEDSAH